jgi:ABC-2 type transport system permease protein
VRRVNTTNLGDLVFGIGLFLAVGHPTLERTAIFVVGVASSAALVTGFLLATGSLSMFLGRDDAGELSFHAMLMFAAYPVEVFGGGARLFLSTVVPAAFISSVPARLIDDFDPWWALAMLGVSALFVVIGVATFSAGLRRYTSGAVWTRA